MAADGSTCSSESTNACGSRKSVSLNNLSEYEQTSETPKSAARVEKMDLRTKPSPVTPRRMNLFRCLLLTLIARGNERVGKGDWKGISRNFVKTRTSTQVASHAQKYCLQQRNLNLRRRRSSLFDMTTDTVMPIEEDQVLMQENTSQSSSLVLEINNFSLHPLIQVFHEFPVPTSGDNVSGNQSYGSNPINLVPLTLQARPAPLSLSLSLASCNLNEPMHSAYTTGVA